MIEKAIVFDIQWASLHDGPGIRTTVFLKGCPLECTWCHNPEALRAEPQLFYYFDKCTQCRACEKVCPHQVHQFIDGQHQVNYDACKLCGKCVDACNYDALTIMGREMSVASVREQLAADFEQTLSSLAAIGYRHVELAGLHGHAPEYVHQVLLRNNLQVIAMHCDVLTERGLEQSLYAAEILGCQFLVCPWVQPETFSTAESIQDFAAVLNKVNRKINAQGKTLLYHNHAFEFQELNGRVAFDLFVEQLDSGIKLQLDFYNAACAGVDPLTLVGSERLIMLHFKDGAILPAEPHSAIGQGAMNYPQLMSHFPKGLQWGFVEIEYCQTDIWEALESSVRYLSKF
jgi:sugar phosphate isomerase/epimerase/NAD-dependent dihydropyrimidine dehydrogenase PreA subunit